MILICMASNDILYREMNSLIYFCQWVLLQINCFLKKFYG